MAACREKQSLVASAYNPSTQRLKREDHKFKASLAHIVYLKGGDGAIGLQPFLKGEPTMCLVAP